VSDIVAVNIPAVWFISIVPQSRIRVWPSGMPLDVSDGYTPNLQVESAATVVTTAILSYEPACKNTGIDVKTPDAVMDSRVLDVVKPLIE
jgi:hypothetical protein